MGCLLTYLITDYLSPLLQTTGGKNKSIILLGDFNINLLKYDNPVVVSIFLDTLRSYILAPQIVLPTRIGQSVKL